MKNLFELIPADMLEYSNIMKQYTVVSDEEAERIVKNCLEAGIEPENVHLYVLVIVNAKLRELLIQRYIDGFLSVSYDEENNELNFEPIHDK